MADATLTIDATGNLEISPTAVQVEVGNDASVLNSSGYTVNYDTSSPPSANSVSNAATAYVGVDVWYWQATGGGAPTNIVTLTVTAKGSSGGAD